MADVNIPVGEVFTSPVLAGTEGLEIGLSRILLPQNRDLIVLCDDLFAVGIIDDSLLRPVIARIAHGKMGTHFFHNQNRQTVQN